jgi:hypothetical protein
VDGLGWEHLDGVCETVLAWPPDAATAWLLDAAADPVAERRVLVRYQLALCLAGGRLYCGRSGELAGLRAAPLLAGSVSRPPPSVDLPYVEHLAGSTYPVGLSTGTQGRLFDLAVGARTLTPPMAHLSLSVHRPELFADPLRTEIEGVAAGLDRPLIATVAEGEEGPLVRSGWLAGPVVAGKRRSGRPGLQLWSTAPLRR